MVVLRVAIDFRGRLQLAARLFYFSRFLPHIVSENSLPAYGLTGSKPIV